MIAKTSLPLRKFRKSTPKPAIGYVRYSNWIGFNSLMSLLLTIVGFHRSKRTYNHVSEGTLGTPLTLSTECVPWHECFLNPGPSQTSMSPA